MRSRFARIRVRAAHRDDQRSQLRAREWLLIEWPQGHKDPMNSWLSTLPEDTPLHRMVLEAKMRWRIEPRGSPAHAAPRPIVHNDFAAAYRRRLAQDTASMPVLPAR